MRFGALLLVSTVIGACTAAYTVPRAAQPIPNPIEQPRHVLKPLIKPSGTLDPDIDSRLESVERELRGLQGDLTDDKPGVAQSDK